MTYQFNRGATFREETQPTWERFWIRPAAVIRRTSDTQRLTLVDVPLEGRDTAHGPCAGQTRPCPGPHAFSPGEAVLGMVYEE